MVKNQEGKLIYRNLCTRKTSSRFFNYADASCFFAYMKGYIISTALITLHSYQHRFATER